MRALSSATLCATLGGVIGLAASLAIAAYADQHGVDSAGVVFVGAGTLLVPLLAATGLTVGVVRTGDRRTGPVEPDETGHERP